MNDQVGTTSPYMEEELAEIRELFPELTPAELQRLITALDLSIDQVLDHYFGLNQEPNHTLV